MSTLSLRLPESLHRRLSEVAEKEGVSINQLISSAVGEKMSALMTEDYLSARANRGNKSQFMSALARIPDVEAADTDRLESSASKPAKRTRRPVVRR